MFAKDILREKGSDVHCIDCNVTLMEVVDELVDHRIGALVVTQNGKMIGIITERDILHASAYSQRPLSETPLNTSAIREVVTAKPTDRISDLMGLMTEKHVRHIPVLDGEELIGIVSIGDVVKAQHAASQAETACVE